MLEPQHARVEIGTPELPLFDDDTDTLADEPKPQTPWWRSRTAIIVASAVVIVALLGGTLAAVARGRGSQVTYTTQQVSTGNLTVSVSATGPVQSPTYNVSVSGSSKIAEIDVKVGQQVKAGDTLAKLDVTSLQDALNQAQAQVNSAQVALNNAYTSLNKTTTSAHASENSAYQTEQVTLAGCSSPKNGETTSQCQNQAYAQYNAAVAQAEAQISSAQGQASSAQASLASAQAGVQTAQHNLSNATIAAPHAGTVAAINGEVGGAPGGSSSSSASGSGGSGSAFIEIADLSSLQVAANVNEADIGSVATGEQVQFTVTAYSSRQFRGTVSAISPVGQTSSNVVTYPVTIDVDMTRVQGVNLFPGMTASVTIVTAQRVGVTLVPARAVTFARTAANPANGIVSTTDLRNAALQAAQKLRALRTSNPDIAKDNPTAAVVLERSNGKWVIKPVILGLTDGANYAVLDGLTSGEAVVTGQQGGTLSTSTGGTTPFGGNGNGRGNGGLGGGFGGGFGGGGNGGAGRGNGG